MGETIGAAVTGEAVAIRGATGAIEAIIIGAGVIGMVGLLAE